MDQKWGDLQGTCARATGSASGEPAEWCGCIEGRFGTRATRIRARSCGCGFEKSPRPECLLDPHNFPNHLHRAFHKFCFQLRGHSGTVLRRNMIIPFEPKILVVDDEPVMLDLLNEGLIQAKCAPRCVESGQEALDLINKEKFDGIFLDWMMPGMDGLELVKNILRSDSNSACPIVMVTAKSDREAMKECFKAGVSFFLQKPVSFEQIQSLVLAAYDLMLQEHLRYHRVPFETNVIFQWQSESSQEEIRGTSVNISGSGMCAILDSAPPSGVLVNVKFSLDGAPNLLDLTGLIVQVWPNNRVGIRFINLAQDQRRGLMQFAESVLANTTKVE
jgi:CheY-like chemotaxis protein